MEMLSIEPLVWPAVALSLLHAIVLIQSGWDKVTDFSGNLGWLKEHFAQTPFRNQVKLLTGILTAMELVSGILSLAAAVALLFMSSGRQLFFCAMLAVSLTYLFLILGQRIAKDYPGAATLVPYILGAVLGLILATFPL